MRLLFLSDTQLGGGAGYGTPERPRLADAADYLDEVVDIAAGEDVDLLVFCGDAFQHRRPAVDELLVFGRFLGQLPCDFVLVAGNHDCRGPSPTPTTLDLFGERGDTLFVTPGLKGCGDAALAFLPWSHPGPLRAAQSGVTPLEQAEALVKIAADLRERIRVVEQSVDECRPQRMTPILVTHHALSGMSLPTGLSTGELVGEPVLDTDALLEQGWRAVIAGHVHAADVVFRDHPEGGCAVSVGSPWIHDFGEAAGTHGVVLFDTDGEVFKRVELSGRRFVTIDLDGEQRPGLLDWFYPEDVAGAVVRVRIRCTEQAARDLDVEAIRRGLLEAGAHKVHAVTLDVERKVRARAEQMAEDAGPLTALDSWLEATGAGSREGERLRDLTRQLLLEQEV